LRVFDSSVSAKPIGFPEPVSSGIGIRSSLMYGYRDGEEKELVADSVLGSVGFAAGSLAAEAWGRIDAVSFRWDYPETDVDAVSELKAAGFRFSIADLAGGGVWIENGRPYGDAFLYLPITGNAGIGITGGLAPAFSGVASFDYPFQSIVFGADLLTGAISARMESPLWSSSLSLLSGTSIEREEAKEPVMFSDLPLVMAAASTVALKIGGFGLNVSAMMASARIAPLPAELVYAECDDFEPLFYSVCLQLDLPFPITLNFNMSQLTIPSGEGYFSGSDYLFLFGSILGEERLTWTRIQASRIGAAIRGTFDLAGMRMDLEAGYDAIRIDGNISISRKETQWISTGPFFWQGRYVDSWPVLTGTAFAEVPDGAAHFGIGIESGIGRNQSFTFEARQYIPVNIPRNGGSTSIPSIPSIPSGDNPAYGGLLIAFGWKWVP